MKKTVFFLCICNVLTCLVFYFVYRFILIETTSEAQNWFEGFLELFEVFFSVLTATVIFGILVLNSLLILLNLSFKIRENIYLSLITFSLVPFLLLTYLLVIWLKDFYDADIKFITNLIFVLSAYLIFTLIEFLILRLLIKKSKHL